MTPFSGKALKCINRPKKKNLIPLTEALFKQKCWKEKKRINKHLNKNIAVLVFPFSLLCFYSCFLKFLFALSHSISTLQVRASQQCDTVCANSQRQTISPTLVLEGPCMRTWKAAGHQSELYQVRMMKCMSMHTAMHNSCDRVKKFTLKALNQS